MNILIGYERFSRVRNAFAQRGHNAFSVDIEPDAAPMDAQCGGGAAHAV